MSDALPRPWSVECLPSGSACINAADGQIVAFCTWGESCDPKIAAANAELIVQAVNAAAPEAEDTAP